MCDIFGFACDRGIYEFDKHQYDVEEEVFFGCGAFLAVSKDVWSELGGFDDDYFIYFEDCDLCWRGRLRGYRVIYSPPSKVQHLYGGTISPGSDFRYYLRERNRLSTMVKNYSFKTLLLILPRYTGLKAAEVVAMTSVGKSRVVTALARAIMWNIRHFPRTYTKRLEIQKKRVIDDNEILSKMTKDSIEIRRYKEGYLKFF
jgi:GT2 family glycosyltransferase